MNPSRAKASLIPMKGHFQFQNHCVLRKIPKSFNSDENVKKQSSTPGSTDPDENFKKHESSVTNAGYKDAEENVSNTNSFGQIGIRLQNSLGILNTAENEKDDHLNTPEGAKPNPLKDTKQNPLKDTNQNPLKDTNQNPLKDTKQNPLKDTIQNPLKDTNQNPLKDTKPAELIGGTLLAANITAEVQTLLGVEKNKSLAKAHRCINIAGLNPPANTGSKLKMHAIENLGQNCNHLKHENDILTLSHLNLTYTLIVTQLNITPSIKLTYF